MTQPKRYNKTNHDATLDRDAAGLIAPCERCGGRVAPDTDGDGGALERCLSCGWARRISRAIAAAGRWRVRAGSGV